MKKTLLTSIIVTNLALLSACGGGGSTASTSTSTSTAANAGVTVKGSVPGTLIEAFCDNGAYYAVNSTQNGTSRHPFEITLPANMGCNLVMTTNENDPANSVVTPIGFIDATSGQLLPRISAASGVVIDLDFVSLFTSRVDAAGSDANGDGVIDSLYDVGEHSELTVQAATTALDSDGDGIIEPYDDEDDDGVINRDDADYAQAHASDADHDGLSDAVDVNPDNDRNASNTYPASLDQNSDGYLDDDKNKDGFHDDDLNKDGFHDDDLNHDGQHDGNSDSVDGDSDTSRNTDGDIG